MFPTFAFWMHVAAKQQRVVLIPNYLWKQLSFASICAMVTLSYGVLQTMELFCTLLFQNLQRVSPLQSSLQLLPGLVVGSIIGLSTGAFVHPLSPKYLVFVSSLLSSGASLIMALAKPEWPYWWASFPAQLLQPVSNRWYQPNFFLESRANTYVGCQTGFSRRVILRRGDNSERSVSPRYAVPCWGCF